MENRSVIPKDQWYRQDVTTKGYHRGIIIIIIIILRWSFALIAQAGVQWHNLCSLQPPPPQVQAILLPQSPKSSWDYRCLPPHPANFFVFLVETEFCHVG